MEAVADFVVVGFGFGFELGFGVDVDVADDNGGSEVDFVGVVGGGENVVAEDLDVGVD